MLERIFRDYAAAYGLQFVTLRYFNAAGADPEKESVSGMFQRRV